MLFEFCKGKIIEKETTFLIEINKTVIVIRNVPSLVCEQCGEISYTDVRYTLSLKGLSLRSAIL